MKIIFPEDFASDIALFKDIFLNFIPLAPDFMAKISKIELEGFGLANDERFTNRTKTKNKVARIVNIIEVNVR